MDIEDTELYKWVTSWLPTKEEIEYINKEIKKYEPLEESLR